MVSEQDLGLLCKDMGLGVSSLLFFRVLLRGNPLPGLSFVCNFSAVTVLSVGGVGDDLSTAVGEENSVLAGDLLAVGVGLVTVGVVGLVVLDEVPEVEGHQWLGSRKKHTHMTTPLRGNFVQLNS